jgi:hypothetical protein
MTLAPSLEGEMLKEAPECWTSKTPTRRAAEWFRPLHFPAHPVAVAAINGFVRIVVN